MSQNLITAGIIDSTQLPLDEIRQEVAAFLKISLNKIERIECWRHQIWVKLAESRAKFVSYRSLPIWIEEGISAIKRCTTRCALVEIGEILRCEREWYDRHAIPETVQPWRDAWAKQAQDIKQEEKLTQPMRLHQEAGNKWYCAWQQILLFCRDCTALEGLAAEINRQSQEFADLPEVMAAMQQLWQERWQNLSAAIA
ncbi:hypothetical protein [Limnofasciculus baicalensis]|uniref:Uncharacterized protein n=1 Tax=Limnofasciculus baicalensis BBK-W-15 TaxID=2699891 RepID=A0AAE3KNL6_9CYAN|nr:hypothetical protein [Limnofasciculus baicalensis]MCP2730650.1 hypothetical protein [Limnofasciculus baicalensis BBK-W-15]